MCLGGGGGSSGPSPQQQAIQQQQFDAQQAASAAALAEQKREYDIAQQQRQQDLATAAAQQKALQDQVDQQAALTHQWQTGRTNEATQARQSVEDAFSQFTPDYYKKFVSDYQANYNPEVTRQYNLAKQQLTYGLARGGILQSQSAATQQGLLAQDQGRHLSDIANQAVSAGATLQGNVAQAKQNLLNSALSDQTLGSPITPGSADAIQAGFDTTSHALSQIKTSAGDVINTLAAPPSYSPLGNLFGNAASGVASYIGGQYYAGSGQGQGAPSPGAANPTGNNSSVVRK